MRKRYRNLKAGAKRRGIPFKITFRYFLKFARKTALLTKRGRQAGSFTVDRRKNELGYIRGNIQALTLRENVIKHAKQDAKRIQHGYAWNNGKPKGK